MNNNQTLVFLKQDLKQVEFFAKIQQLIQTFNSYGEFLSYPDDQEMLACYNQDGQSVYTKLPLLVFKPFSFDCLSSFIQQCGQNQIPITIRGAGTGLVGGSLAASQGVILLIGHFKTILNYEAKSGQVIVQPGVTIRQVNQLVYREGWYIPIEMATLGVASLGGCLSSSATGYHQTRQWMSHLVISALLLDGKGQQIEVPGDLLAGSEGLLGIVTQLTLQLVPIPHSRLVLKVQVNWSDFLKLLKDLKRYQAITSIIWQDQQEFVIIVEGEKWRLRATLNALTSIFTSYSILTSHWQPRFLPDPYSLILSSVVPLEHVESAIVKLEALAASLKLRYKLMVNVLDYSFHLILSTQTYAKIDPYTIQQFLVEWINILTIYSGFLMSRHGIGTLLRHYSPAIFSETNFDFLRNLQKKFDPDQIFSRERFFPEIGKSLEKMIDNASEKR